MKNFSLSILFLGLISCEDDRALECRVLSAKSGYSIVTPLSYDYEYLYTYTEGKLTNVKILDINSREEISTTEFDYDAEGRVSLETTIASGGNSYRHYKYELSTLIITSYTVIGSDTSSFVEEQHFYVKDPKNKVYHHPPNKTSLKFQNGNLVEYGTYEVLGTDTTAIFYERYFYDNNANYYNSPEYRIAIPSDFIWAKIVSKNNLVQAQYIDGGWDFSYSYTYADNGRLDQYVGKSGITIAFEDKCW